MREGRAQLGTAGGCRRCLGAPKGGGEVAVGTQGSGKVQTLSRGPPVPLQPRAEPRVVGTHKMLQDSWDVTAACTSSRGLQILGCLAPMPKQAPSTRCHGQVARLVPGPWYPDPNIHCRGGGVSQG